MAVAGVRTAVPYCAPASARAVSRQIELCAVPAGLRACLGAWRGQAVRQQRRPAAASGFRRGLHLLRALQRPDYAVREEGQPETLDYRVFFSDKLGKTISPWHDIPLHAGNGLFNFVVEIPKETKAKMEVATDETHNPIKQDTKKGKLRYYPYNINWNYGLLPQTWEDPEHSNKEVEAAFGDNDPVDVVEIGERQAKIGDVVKVKPLAVLAMIDEGELDWKVVAISVDDPKASLVNDVESVEKHFPGTLTAIRDWFRDYKIPDGKPANKFGLGNKPADKDYALSVIAETNQAWAKLAKKSAAAAVTPESIQADTTEPLLLRAVRGEIVERPPVWLMRQAGRYMKVYQQLCEKYPTFRERSENVDVAVEVSLQPWRAFKPDGVILFSDILTPLTGMNIPFDILKSKGPVIHKPIRTAADVAEVRELVPEEAVPYVGEALAALRSEVGNASTVLGFVGAPFTLASYIVEGGSSKHFTVIKRLAFETPEILHSLLQKLAESVIIYTRYQADKGAQAVQIFDSWATHLSPKDFEVFSLPYIKQIVREVKATHPHLPLILYASGSGGLLERMATADVDVISLDWTVDMAEARQRVGTDRAVQGNIDPGVLFGTKDFISQRIHETVAQAGSRKHILNLGHGVLLGTPEESVAHFFEVAKGLRY